MRLGAAFVCLLLLSAACSGGSDTAPTQAESPVAAGDPVSGQAPWWDDAVFYEVFVRSYRDSDGDGNGDLQGLVDRLDYLNDGNPSTDDDLGVTGLWLMPVTQSPSYHGYDTTDYFTVEEDYGSNADLRRVVDEAHERGIAVIVDLMLNHTSVEHPWFVEAASEEDSDHRDFYVWREENPGHQAPWGGPVWHPSDGDYYHGLFWEGMPDLNYRNPAVTEQMYRVADFWLEEMGVDGFRLDAVRHLVEDGEQYAGTPQTHEWLTEWDDHIDQVDPDALTVGEVWGETAVVAPYVRDDEVDVAFEFSLAEAILDTAASGDASALAATLASVLQAYPPGQFATFLTNHDQDRVMTQLDGDVGAAASAASLLLTLPGVPFVYYGEEIGMRGGKPDEFIRTPMQWSAEENAGFSDGVPWQAPRRTYASVNVAAQAAADDSLLDHYRRLIGLRNEQPSLRTGGFEALASSCPASYAYLRTAADATSDADVMVVHNLSDEAQDGCAVTLMAGSSPASGTYTVTDLYTGEPAAPLSVDGDAGITGYVPLPTLAPRQTAILLLSRAKG